MQHDIDLLGVISESLSPLFLNFITAKLKSNSLGTLIST